MRRELWPLPFGLWPLPFAPSTHRPVQEAAGSPPTLQLLQKGTVGQLRAARLERIIMDFPERLDTYHLELNF